MKKYAKVVNEETKLCQVGLSNNSKFYQSIGMKEQDVEQAYDGRWYLVGFVPAKPEPTYEEIRLLRANSYAKIIDPMMSEYLRKKTFKLFDEGEEEYLLSEIETRVEEIKSRYPYPQKE